MMKEDKAAGFLRLNNARVRWYLSIDYNDVPEPVRKQGQRTFRSIKVDNEEIEFSGGFTDLHTRSYKKIIDGEGFDLECARKSINTVYDIRTKSPSGKKGDFHPFLKEK